MAWVNVQDIPGVEIKEVHNTTEHAWEYYKEPDGTSFSTNEKAFFQGIGDDHNTDLGGYEKIRIVIPDDYVTLGNIRVTPTVLTGGAPEQPYKNYWDAVELGYWNDPGYSITTPTIGTPIFYENVGKTFYTGCGNGDSAPSAPTATWTIEVEVADPVECNYNCDCDDNPDNKTLKQLRDDLARRLGYGAQVDNLPPGMEDLLNSFLIEAQELLYWRYPVLRTERFFTWNMTAGTRYYDLDANRDTCTKRLNPRMVTWAGISQGCGDWTELRCGIDPLVYSSEDMTGRPERYEIRQCIEVWPAPDADDTYQLRIKGRFGLEAFAADTDKTTIDSRPVFLLALANAKAHYGKPDANNYIAQLETMMQNLVGGTHQTRNYIPGVDPAADMVYTRPKPTVPFT